MTDEHDTSAAAARPGMVRRTAAAIPSREAGALAAVVLFLLLGFGAIFFVSRVAKVRDGAVLAAVLIIPSLLYMLLSGRVSDLKGPGGLELRLTAVANQTIPVHGEKGTAALDYDQVRAVERGRKESFLDHIRDITPADPVVLTLTLGSGPIDGDAAADYAKGLTQFPRFRFVAILDSLGGLISYLEERSFRHVIESDAVDSRRLLSAIEQQDVGAVRAYPGMILGSVTPGTSMVAALSQMESLRMSALLVTENGRITGIVERDRIANAVLLSLVSPDAG